MTFTEMCEEIVKPQDPQPIWAGFPPDSFLNWPSSSVSGVVVM